jgi:hypothetical protein
MGTRHAFATLGCLALGIGLIGCGSAAAPLAVVAASPPKDDGKAAEGGEGGVAHSAALEALRTGAAGTIDDRQNSIRVTLLDSAHWTRVKFWGVPSLVGFRYGKDHHGIAGAFVTHVPDNTVRGACDKSFESFATPLIQLFEVEVENEPVQSFAWRNGQTPQAPPQILSIDTVLAKTATALARDTYAAAYAIYPAWPGACLILGVAIPSRGDEPRARAARDAVSAKLFSTLQILVKEEPKERY